MKSILVLSTPRPWASSSSAARNLDGDGNEIAVAGHAEVVDFQGDGEVRHGVAQHERFLQLALLIGGVEFAELLAGEVAGPVIEFADLGLKLRSGLQFDAPVAAVQFVVGAVVAEDVVAGDFLLRLHDAEAEIVVVEQRLAAGVGGQRVEGLLLALEGGLLRRAPSCRRTWRCCPGTPWWRRPEAPRRPGRARRWGRRPRCCGWPR